MVLRADDFANKAVWMLLVEEAQNRNIVPKGALSWCEGDSVVDLESLDLNVAPTSITGNSSRTINLPRKVI